MSRRLRVLFLGIFLAADVALAVSPEDSGDAAGLIAWLFEDGRHLEEVPFPRVIEAACGRKVLPVDAVADRERIEMISGAMDAALCVLNDPAHSIHKVERINEASRFVEDALREEINKIPGWSCGVPRTSEGAEQRAGYPDLRIVCADGRVVYLDPKLLDAASRSSSLRTFYFEPKVKTGKVHDDAIHLLAGVQHNGEIGERLRLLRWELLDLSRLKVKLKAEFEASNQDLYRPEALVEKSAE